MVLGALGGFWEALHFTHPGSLGFHLGWRVANSNLLVGCLIVCLFLGSLVVCLLACLLGCLFGWSVGRLVGLCVLTNDAPCSCAFLGCQ